MYKTFHGSSVIRRIRYNNSSKELTVFLHTRKEPITYTEVPTSVVIGFSIADSPGSYYNKFVKGKFSRKSDKDASCSKFKVGDKVYSERYGHGKIVEIGYTPTFPYTVYAVFDGSPFTRAYTPEGKSDADTDSKSDEDITLVYPPKIWDIVNVKGIEGECLVVDYNGCNIFTNQGELLSAAYKDLTPIRNRKPFAVGDTVRSGDGVLTITKIDSEEPYPIIAEEQGGSCCFTSAGKFLVDQKGSLDLLLLTKKKEEDTKETCITILPGDYVIMNRTSEQPKMFVVDQETKVKVRI